MVMVVFFYDMGWFDFGRNWEILIKILKINIVRGKIYYGIYFLPII